eukprot:5153752-Amphidinium_carterae.1
MTPTSKWKTMRRLEKKTRQARTMEVEMGDSDNDETILPRLTERESALKYIVQIDGDTKEDSRKIYQHSTGH